MCQVFMRIPFCVLGCFPKACVSQFFMDVWSLHSQRLVGETAMSFWETMALHHFRIYIVNCGGPPPRWMLLFFCKKKGDSRITEIFEKSIFATKKKPEITHTFHASSWLVYRDPKIMAAWNNPLYNWVVFLSPFVHLNQPGALFLLNFRRNLHL